MKEEQGEKDASLMGSQELTWHSLCQKKGWREVGKERRRLGERGCIVLTLSDRDRGGEERDGETTSVRETCC